MKTLKQIIKYILIVVCFIGIGIYYINFQADGQTSFVSEKTVVYAEPELETKQYTLEPGSSFTALSNTDYDVVKIRYSDENGEDNNVGFIKYEQCHSYVFPTDDELSSKMNIIITVNDELDYTDFLRCFVDTLQEYGVIGVYLEDSEYSENTADISYFCEQQGIPYGSISPCTSEEMDSYFEKKVRDSIENPDGNLSYEILPKVFDITDIPSYMYSHFDNEEEEMMSLCIWRTSYMRPSNPIERYWMAGEMTEDLSDRTILLSTFEDKTGLEYSYISSELVDEIAESFYSVQERLGR